jgi:hypothetical protein
MHSGRPRPVRAQKYYFYCIYQPSGSLADKNPIAMMSGLEERSRSISEVSGRLSALDARVTSAERRGREEGVGSRQEIARIARQVEEVTKHKITR